MVGTSLLLSFRAWDKNVDVILYLADFVGEPDPSREKNTLFKGERV